MRTVTTLWAAAVAVVTLTGPFTTAEAAPARFSDSDRKLRPVFRKRSFNDTDDNLELRDPNAQLGLSIPPLLGGTSSSLPPPGPTDPAHRKHGKTPKHDHISALGGLLSNGLIPSSASSFIPSSSAVSSSSSGGMLLGLPSVLPHTPPLLGTGGLPLTTALGGLTTAVPDVTSDVGKLTRTGALGSAVTSVVSDVTSDVHSAASKLIGTGGVGSVVNSAVSDVTHGVAGATSKLSGALTGTGGIVPDVTGKAGSILQSVQSEATSVVSSLESATTLLPAQITQPVASLASSLESKLSQISLTATDPGLVSALSSGFSSILSNVGATLSGVTAPVGSLVPTVTGPLGSILSNPTSAVGSILSNPTGAVGSILPSLPTSAIPPIIPPLTGSGGVLPSIPSVLPTPTGGITITGPGTTVVVSVPTNTPGTSVDNTGTGVSSTTGSPTDTPSPISSTPQGTGVPVTTPSSGSPSVNTTASTVTTNETGLSHSNTAVPTVTSTTPLSPSTTSTIKGTQNGPDVSIKPTGTDSRTVVSLPTVWTFAPSSGVTTAHTVSGIQTAGSATQSSSGGLPTFLPKLVSPASGMPDPGANFTLIQVGFKFGLNYPFVVGQPESAMQIMAYLPKGISHGLGIEKEQVMMNALMPYDTSTKLGYVTTMAQAYIPKELVDQLQLQIHTSSSPIYYYQEKIAVQQLMRMINPTIPILPGASFDGIGPYGGFDGKAAAGAGSGSGAGAPIGSDAGTTKKVRGTSVGIAGAAVAGAAVYVASMMYVARRYRQRRKRHQRASSVPTAGEMTQRSSGGMGSLFMAGANGRGSTRGSMTIPGGRGSRTSNGSSNGRSIREQGISAPLMSENSLGWN